MVSLADELVTQKTKGTTRLEKIDHLINWQRFGYWHKCSFCIKKI